MNTINLVVPSLADSEESNLRYAFVQIDEWIVSTYAYLAQQM
jgi:hypothetical protein